MAKPSKWAWNQSNGNATAAQTYKAYQAITGKGATANFSYLVWNDIVDKISEQRQAWGDTAWDKNSYINYTKMSGPNREMTAWAFNQAVLNMPPLHDWPWEATLGRTNIEAGDTCYGAYFLYLVNGLNRWIDLTPLYLRLPLNVRLQMHNDVLVCRALRIKSRPRFTWTPHAFVALDPAIHIRSRLNMHTDMSMASHLVHPLYIELVLFGNTHLKNRVFPAKARHIIAHNDVKLDIVGRITFGDVVFLIGAINGEHEGKATLHLPPSMPILIDSSLELSTSGTLTPLDPYSFGAAVFGQHTGEAWVREPDSIAIKENLEIMHSAELRFTFADMLRLLMQLDVELSSKAKLSVDNTQPFAFDLSPELITSADIARFGTLPFSADLAAKYKSSAMIYRRRFSTHRADLTMLSDMKAKAVFAGHELYTSGDLQMLLDIAADVVFARRELYTGAHFIENVAFNARAELTNNKLPTGAHLTDTITFTADAAVSSSIMRTGSALSDTFIGPVADVTINPGNAMPTAVKLLDTTDMSATISTFDNRIYAGGDLTISHDGEGRLQLIGAIDFGGNADSEFTGSATFDYAHTLKIRADLQANHTGSATLSVMRYVLASEIDDILVSELDDLPVADVEFH